MTERTSLERAVVRDRWLVLGSLLLVAGACWAWLVPMARDMYGDMTGPSAWMMSNAWTPAHLALRFAGGVMNLVVIAGLYMAVSPLVGAHL